MKPGAIIGSVGLVIVLATGGSGALMSGRLWLGLGLFALAPCVLGFVAWLDERNRTGDEAERPRWTMSEDEIEDDSEFAALVRDAIEELPEWVQAELEANVAIVIADDGDHPSDYGVFGHDRIWGLYLAGHAGRSGARIVIFRDQITAAIDDPDELRHQVGITLRHEIAHHFGADEARVRELGL